MRKQREEKDFWDKYKDVKINSSSHKYTFDEYSFENKELMVKDGRRDNI